MPQSAYSDVWTDDQANFPETFNWNLLDSPKLTALAWKIAFAIDNDMETKDRNLVPGLREALLLLATTAVIDRLCQ